MGTARRASPAPSEPSAHESARRRPQAAAAGAQPAARAARDFFLGGVRIAFSCNIRGKPGGQLGLQGTRVRVGCKQTMPRAKSWPGPRLHAYRLARAAPANFRGRASLRSSCHCQAQLSQHGTAARAHLLGAYDCERGTGEGSVERRQAARRDGVQVWVRVRVIQGKRACGRAGGRVQKQQQQQGLLWCVALAWLWLRVGVGVGRRGRRSASASTWELSGVLPCRRSPNLHS